MSHIKVEAITALSKEMNTASNLQQAITGAAQFNERLMLEIQRQREEARRKQEQVKQTPFKFDPKDIQTLVYRPKPNNVKISLEEQNLKTEKKVEREER